MKGFNPVTLLLLLILALTESIASSSGGKSKAKTPTLRQAIPAAKLLSSSTTLTQLSDRTSERKNENAKVIMVLETRDHRLTVYGQDGDRLYSVGTKDGVALAEKLTTPELKTRFPELHELVTTGVAVDSPMGFK